MSARRRRIAPKKDGGLKRLNGRHDAQTIKRGYLKILNNVGNNESSIYRRRKHSVRFKNEHEVLHGETGNAGCEEVTAVSISSDKDDNASTCPDGDLFDPGEDGIDDFEQTDREIVLDIRFPKRLSCMAHTLQLAAGSRSEGVRKP
ncbi:hypothetical protein Tcan_14152 [Toxocara canis]|uniref:Uncharacterized protein n=1 Tax=Toxocara canis TaxID=6265 RepID=A0A0B2V056_TOXCA|nr:hypothetical protein Tcan_14152 [Toxocara canis]